ncbi:GNAT family N-acetyltransferase [Tateyamaria sp.]|uniref:GNAT family N-acetyltransferase n=1 Tax=Tateyamaria sp. TaxID=1929288 RepID=UPI003B211E36
MSRHVPTINTARTTLRAMRHSDFDRYVEIWSMPEVVRFTGGAPRSRDLCWQKFLSNAGHWQMTGFGQWAVEDHDGKRMIGQTGFFYGARGVGEDFDAVPEAGWVLSPEVHGKGLGREATRAAHDWFDRVITGPLVCMIEPAHAVSLHLAEALGYVPMRDTVYEGAEVRLLLRKSPPQI